MLRKFARRATSQTRCPTTTQARGLRVIGKYTNDIVYERLAPSVLDEL